MKAGTNPTEYVFVPLPTELFAELVRRSGKADMSGLIEHSVQTFLDRTVGDTDIWSEEYIEKLVEQEDEAFREKYGDPGRGYQWQNLFLPNGTQIRMTYGGEDSYAEIRHGRLHYGDESMSPSQFAGKVAQYTTRNAWRDLYIKFPGEGGWKLADHIRGQNRRGGA